MKRLYYIPFAFAIAALSAIAVKTLAKDAPPAAAAARSAALQDIQKTFGFVPQFLNDIPALALPGTWEEMKTLQLSDKTAIPPKYKELIGLGVSAQVPCTYCVHAHTEFSRSNGASPDEIGEAIAMSALVRHWSTFMNGMQLDETQFRKDVARMVANAKAAKPAGAAAPKPINVVDGKTALEDANRTLGFTPEFLKSFPEAARAGAWKGLRDVEMNPNSALPGKYKSLIGLAVSSQIPCDFCIVANTEFSRMGGATDAEISEAVAMGAFTRHMSTMMNGLKVDDAMFRSDVARLVKGAQASKTAPQPAPTQVR